MVHLINLLKDEHEILRKLFTEISRCLPETKTLAEVQRLSVVAEHLVAHHTEMENEIAFAALNQALLERQQTDQLLLEHQAKRDHFRAVAAAGHQPEAERLLRKAIEASIARFDWEEQSIFPLMTQVLSPESLEELALTRGHGQELMDHYMV